MSLMTHRAIICLQRSQRVQGQPVADSLDLHQSPKVRGIVVIVRYEGPLAGWSRHFKEMLYPNLLILNPRLGQKLALSRRNDSSGRNVCPFEKKKKKIFFLGGVFPPPPPNGVLLKPLFPGGAIVFVRNGDRTRIDIPDDPMLFRLA